MVGGRFCGSQVSATEVYQVLAEISTAPAKGNDGETSTLQSSTPRAWFRYALDGTPPTRTRSCVDCGKSTLQPSIQLHAIAYKSGMADSTISKP